MGKSAWEYALEIISIATDIDELNTKLSKTDKISEREILSSKIDSLENKLFEIKDKLKSPYIKVYFKLNSPFLIIILISFTFKQCKNISTNYYQCNRKKEIIFIYILT